ncbi:MAG: hypothetical protein WCJ45_06555 [bacterium]
MFPLLAIIGVGNRENLYLAVWEIFFQRKLNHMYSLIVGERIIFGKFLICRSYPYDYFFYSCIQSFMDTIDVSIMQSRLCTGDKESGFLFHSEYCTI